MKEKFSSVEEMRQAIFQSKKERRRALAKLPFPEKIKMLVELQELFIKFNRKGKEVKWKPWKLG